MGLSSSCSPTGQPRTVREVAGARLCPEQRHGAVLSLPAPQLTLRLSLLCAICFPLPPVPVCFPLPHSYSHKRRQFGRSRKTPSGGEVCAALGA